jgi:hypothetical protein
MTKPVKSANKYLFVIQMILLSFCGLLHANAVFAAEATTSAQILSVSPALLPIILSPGKTLSLTLTVTNLTNSPLPLKAEVEGFDSVNEDGGYSVTGDNTGLPSWITVNQPDMIIDSQAGRDIHLTVKVPIQVAVGGYYAIVFLTPYTAVTTNYLPKVVPRIGVPVFASLGIDETMHAGNIETYALSPWLTKSGPLSLTLRVKNAGLSHFSAKPRLTLKPAFGKMAITLDFPEKVILPGKIRRWEETVTQKLPYNWYTATMAVSLGGGRWIEEKSQLVVFPVKEALIMLAAIIIIFFFLATARNLKKAARALLGK